MSSHFINAITYSSFWMVVYGQQLILNCSLSSIAQNGLLVINQMSFQGWRPRNLCWATVIKVPCISISSISLGSVDICQNQPGTCHFERHASQGVPTGHYNEKTPRRLLAKHHLRDFSSQAPRNDIWPDDFNRCQQNLRFFEIVSLSNPTIGPNCNQWL